MKLDILNKKNDDHNHHTAEMTRRNPFDLLSFPFSLENRFFQTLSDYGWLPKMDVSQTPQAIKICMNVPAVKPEDITLEIDEDCLTISGKTETHREEHDETYYRMEREEGQFQRTVALPHGVETDKIEAHLKNGVLTVDIPKKETSPKKKIPINT